MGSPMSQNPNVKQVIDAVHNRDVEWLQTLYDKKLPNPAHLMYACSVVVGEGGYENIGQLMSQTKVKDRRGALVDILVKFASSEEAPQVEVVEEVVVEEIVEEQPKKRRRRRSKAEIEADKAAEAASAVVETQAVNLEKDGTEWRETMDLIREISKSVFNLEERIESIESSIKVLNNHSKQTAESLEASTILTARMLTSIKEGLCAGELDLIINGKLQTPAISDTIGEIWPVKDEDGGMPF